MKEMDAYEVANSLDEIGRIKDMGRPPVEDVERLAAKMLRSMQSRLESLERTKESLCKALDEAGDSLIEVGGKIESLENDAARYRWCKQQDTFGSMVRDSTGDCDENTDSVIDAAMQANKETNA